MIQFIRNRPSLCIVIVTVIVGIIGTILGDGWGFLVRPLPVPRFWAMLGMTTNCVLATIAMIYVYRNLHRFERDWTWQERGFSRGTFLIVFAGSLGYFGRAFTEPSATLATPVYTIGVLWLIWASIRIPERFDKEDQHASTR